MVFKENIFMLHCSYYQARVQREKCWFLVAVLRSFEHLAFDRTLDVDQSIFEFFVPASTEDTFVELMEYLQQQGIILEVHKMENRLAIT
jgi:hypothetical protein